MKDRFDNVCSLILLSLFVVAIALVVFKPKAQATPEPADAKPKFTCTKLGTTGLGGYVIWEIEFRGHRYLLTSGNGPAICPEVE